MLVTVPVIVTASCAAANAGSASRANTTAITDLTERPMLPPCHLFQKVCGRRWMLVWLAFERTRISRSPGSHAASALPSSLRCDCMRRHDTHAVICGAVRSVSLEEKAHFEIARHGTFSWSSPYSHEHKVRHRTVQESVKCCQRHVSNSGTRTIMAGGVSALGRMFRHASIPSASRWTALALIPLALAGSPAALRAQLARATPPPPGKWRIPIHARWYSGSRAQ